MLILFYFQHKEQGMKETIVLKLEAARLEDKYHRALDKKEVAHELGISVKTLERRMAQGVDVPQYKELRTKRVLFPIGSVAAYLSQGLVQTI